jgi:hypothetical protein
MSPTCSLPLPLPGCTVVGSIPLGPKESAPGRLLGPRRTFQQHQAPVGLPRSGLGLGEIRQVAGQSADTCGAFKLFTTVAGIRSDAF